VHLAGIKEVFAVPEILYRQKLNEFIIFTTDNFVQNIYDLVNAFAYKILSSTMYGIIQN
jgi:hypothetical protein